MSAFQRGSALSPLAIAKQLSVCLCHKLRQDDDDNDYNEEEEDVYKYLQMSQNCQATTMTMMCVFMSQPPEAGWVLLKPSEVIGTIISGFNAVFSAQSPSQRSANTSFNLLRTYSNLVQQEHQRRFKMLSQLSTKSKIQLTLQASQLHHDSIPIEQSNRSKGKQLLNKVYNFSLV